MRTNKHPVIIVTGASKGIGASVALWLGKAGARVVLVARTKEGLEKFCQTIKESGGTAITVSMDIVDTEACRELVLKTLDRFGRLDGIVNNAASVTPLAFIEKADVKAWKACLEVNVVGPFQMAKYAIQELKKRKGRIINVGSGAAHHPIEAASAYCASKAALIQFTAVLAAEEPDITTVAVRPGMVDTDMQAYLRHEGLKVMPKETGEYYLDVQSRGLLEPPEIPARSIAWLALHAPHEMSGEFRNYDDPDINGPAFDLFAS